MNSVERLEARQLLAAQEIWQTTGLDQSANPADTIVVEAVPEKAAWIRATVNGRKVGARRAANVLGIAIDAGDGNDLVRVRLGADFANLRITVRGGAGDDVLIGSAARDTLRGGAGDDHLDGRGNSNVLHGKRGADRIRHQPDRDLVRGGDAGDRFVARVRAKMITPKTAAPAAATVSDAINQFAFAVYRELLEEQGDEDLLFSPSTRALPIASSWSGRAPTVSSSSPTILTSACCSHRRGRRVRA